ncbi:response regulator [Paenibacillus algorifonticola]|uniref:response regulator n=1 Tax=Paenibacillus algorifonticola TaxID=684063 RepID=UPI003D2D9532
MKVLIVDDEKHVRLSIRHLVDWAACGVDQLFEAENGSEAKRLIQEQRPDLVITDIMMPLATGIELMEWMQSEAPDCEKIVISGYNDFEYARQTLKHGGIDYLLKPIDQKQLQEAVCKAMSSLNTVRQEKLQSVQHGMEMNEVRPIFRDKWLTALLNDSVAQAAGSPRLDWERLYREVPKLSSVTSGIVAVIDAAMLPRPVQEKFTSNPDLLLFSILNICNEMLQQSGCGIAFRNWHKRYEIVLLFWNGMEQANAAIEAMEQGFASALKTRIHLGVSTAHCYPQDIRTAYAEALLALQKRNLLQTAPYICRLQDGTAPARASSLRFGDFTEELRLSISSGRTEQISLVLGKWLQELAKLEHITLEQLEKWHAEYSVNKFRWIEAYTGEVLAPFPDDESPFALPLDDEGKLSLTLLEQQLTQELATLASLLAAGPGSRSSSSIHEIARYIEEHYKEDITLSDISAKFHFNREYISRRFRQEFGETLIEYLNRIRVEKAKILLLNKNHKITEVAQLVGYQDEKYFSRVFKKVTGQTPKEYRNIAAAN